MRLLGDRAGRTPKEPVAQARTDDQPIAGRPGFTERVLVTLAGVRQPIVAILLAVSFMTVISGKPVDGLLLFVVATALAMDAGARVEGPEQSAWGLRDERLPTRVLVPGVTAAVVYSLTFGSFERYSWPATAGVVGVGASAVVVSWGGPLRRRAVPGKFSPSAIFTWTTLLVLAGIWELIALLGQPNIETGSYAHPTISTLTDPLLAHPLGRAFALLAWLGLGFFLVER
jgi:hypothetical protein